MPHSRNKHWELYNLSTDPAEQNNVIKLHPEIVKALEKQITEIVCKGRTTPGKPQPNDTGWWNDLAWITKNEYKKLSCE